MALTQCNRLFDEANIELIPDREFRVLNALDVSIHRSLHKYEVIYQIVAQDKTEINRNLVLLTWELVDWFERTRKILGYGAGLKKKDPAFGLIIRALGNAEEFRHVLQHFDSFLKRSMETDFAPLGAVSVIHSLGDGSFRTLVFNAGTVRGETDMGATELPVRLHDQVDFVTLQIDGRTLNVSEICLLYTSPSPRD